MLLESVVAIALTTLLMAALASFFSTAVASTGSQRARQTATQVAGSRMEALRALPASDLLTGRDSASVTAQLAAAAPAVQRTLADMSPATDATAGTGSGATAVVPTTATTQVLGPTTYTVSTYLGSCRVNGTATSTCAQNGTAGTYLRAVVAVTWPGAHCPAPACSYVTSTLLSPDDDPVFALNQAPSSPAPKVQVPGTQTSTIAAATELRLAVEDGTGIPTMTWRVTQGALPSGLILSTDGVISGTPTGPAGTTSVQVTVTDAFLRTDTATFAWRVVAGPTITAPATQTTTAGAAVTLTPSATCPNGPCRFALNGAPAGLSIDPSSGTITGRPTTPGTYDGVTVTTTDAAGVSASASFRWVVTTASLVATDPGPQKSTLGTTITRLQLTATGGSGSSTWSVVSGLPAGLSLSTGGQVTGTPTTPGAGTVTVKATDAAGGTATVSFLWTVVQQPTIAAQSPVTTSVGVPSSVGVAYTCPYASCTLTLTGGVPGVGLSTSSSTTGSNTGNNATTSVIVTATSGTVYLAGTAQPSAVTSGTSTTYTPTLRITDGAGAAASSTGSWQVYAAATVSSPGSLTATVSTTRAVALDFSCPSASCTLALADGVPGVGLSTSRSTTGNNTARSLTVPNGNGTVFLAGTVQDTAVGVGASTAAYAPKVSITGAGGTWSSAAGSWTIYARPSLGSLPARSVTVGVAKAEPIDYTCPNASCTLALTGAVPGLGLGTTSAGGTESSTTTLTVGSGSGTAYLTGRVAASAVPSGTSQGYPTTVTITDAATVAATGSATWTAYTPPTITNPGSQAVRPSRAFTVPILASCPNGACSYTAEAQPSGSTSWKQLTLDSRSRLTEASGVPNGGNTIRLTVTDADGVSAVDTFRLTVQDFTLTIPNQDTRQRGNQVETVTLDVSALVGPRADGYTYTLSGQPGWLTISPSGVLTATITRDSTSAPRITVTVTSTASPTSSVSSTFSWTIS